LQQGNIQQICYCVMLELLQVLHHFPSYCYHQWSISLQYPPTKPKLMLYTHTHTHTHTHTYIVYTNIHRWVTNYWQRTF
jgi:hypothetical protein